MLASFQQTNEPLRLVDPSNNNSSDCYPFIDSIGPFPTTPNNPDNRNYFESDAPQCVLVPAQPVVADPVCVYQFGDDETCMGREYRMLTVDRSNVDDTTMMVAHAGACGVCSNAQDLSVRFAAIMSFRSAVTSRATS